ncbi:Mg2+ transporter zinc transport protein [Rutstroemia sp. NJR-2017a BBW]|nr:Mg2+ transporter zinc transport protein [Rutstroemia sp. NJR-2017a BBW]
MTSQVYETKHPVEDPRWLSIKDTYAKVVRKLVSRNPTLGKPDPKKHHLESRIGASRCTIFTLNSNKTATSQHFTTASSIKEYFLRRRKPEEDGIHRTTNCIHILEGLDPEFVDVYGSYLMIDPIFFAKQDRNDVWDLLDLQDDYSDTELLPSLTDPDKYFRLKYREMRRFGPDFKHWRTVCSVTGSHLAAVGFQWKLDSIAALERKCSFWFRKPAQGSEGWDAIILCDPPLRRVFSARNIIPQAMKSTPFQGGYLDFLGFDTLMRKDDGGFKEGPPRTCMFDDLCFYFENHSNVLLEAEGASPAFIASVFLKKIVASHYMKVIDYFDIVLQRLSHIEYRLTRHIDWEGSASQWSEKQEQWSSLQFTLRRLTEYSTDAQSILSSLQIPPTALDFPPRCPGISSSNSASLASQLSTDRDFLAIYARLLTLKSRVTSSMSSTQALSSIMANRDALKEARRSVKEARNAKAFTIMGLIFIPLAYTSALFSMSGEYGPGEGRFWVYWAVALPMMILVSGVAWGLSRLDEVGWRRWGKEKES